MAVLKNMLKVGDTVSFGKSGDKPKVGKVTKVNQKTANIKTSDGEYRVTFNYIMKPASKREAAKRSQTAKKTKQSSVFSETKRKISAFTKKAKAQSPRWRRGQIHNYEGGVFNIRGVDIFVNFGADAQMERWWILGEINSPSFRVDGKFGWNSDPRIIAEWVEEVLASRPLRNPANKPRLGGRYQAMVAAEDDWAPPRGGSMAFADTVDAPTMPRRRSQAPRRAPRGSTPPRRSPRQNPASFTKKGERMYDHIRRGYSAAGDPRAKEIASRTVYKQARTTPGLVKKKRK